MLHFFFPSIIYSLVQLELVSLDLKTLNTVIAMFVGKLRLIRIEEDDDGGSGLEANMKEKE